METYIVKFSYKAPNSPFTTQMEETVRIDGKRGHRMAEDEIKKRYPGCKIISVKYH